MGETVTAESQMLFFLHLKGHQNQSETKLRADLKFFLGEECCETRFVPIITSGVKLFAVHIIAGLRLNMPSGMLNT